ncbi:MAG: hydroxymethylglutaryl-CoA synthase [Tissierellia bacterium]|nr:hydroxymethylglutaryl-CoA synthase [Tissierellia bacterium]
MIKSNKVGIEKIGIYIPKDYINLSLLAEFRGVDPNKWKKGIGQENMSVMPKDQDVISMGANSCLKILDDEDKEKIDQVIFATESSIDFSKASSTYIHNLLGIQEFAKSYEIKQACYSATAAIQLACDYVRLRPDRKILIIASDVSKYGLKSSGEVTQGAGAISLLISSKAKILEITNETVSYTENSFDFWRPSYSDYPYVEGKYSTQLYINAFVKLVEEFDKRYPEALLKTDSIIYHLPFTKMGKKALDAYYSLLKTRDDDKSRALLERFDSWYENFAKSTIFSKEVGNIYTGSLYLSLLSLLMNGDLKAGDKIALFSYGSGSVAELYTGILSEDYKNFLYRQDIDYLLERRHELSVEEYESNYFHQSYIENVGDVYNDEAKAEEGFYLEKIIDSKRYYKLKK